MIVKTVTIGGFRDVGEGHSFDNINLKDVVFTFDKLIKKFWQGSDEDFKSFMETINLQLPETKLSKIEYFKQTKEYVKYLFSRAIRNENFDPRISRVNFTQFVENFGVMQTHDIDLSDFNDIEFKKISDRYKEVFTTNSPLAFMNVDPINKRIIITETRKTLTIHDDKIISSLGSKGKDELSNGLNMKVQNFKNFNFNMNIEARLLNDVIFEALDTKRDDMQMIYRFRNFTSRIYTESDLIGKEISEAEIKAISSLTAQREPANDMFKARQGSVSPQETSKLVEERVIVDTDTAIEDEEKVEEAIMLNDDDTDEISKMLKAHTEQIEKARAAYADFGRSELLDAQNKSTQYVNEFYAFIDGGDTVEKAMTKIKERYAKNPYIAGMVDVTITGELGNILLNKKIIEALQHKNNSLQSDLKVANETISVAEEKATVALQAKDAAILAHSKELNKIEEDIKNTISSKDASYNELNDKFMNLIKTSSLLEELNDEYVKEIEKLKPLENENTSLKLENEELKNKIKQLETSNKTLETQIKQLETSNKTTIENYEAQFKMLQDFKTQEIEVYKTQIEQLKETLSLLKLSKEELQGQLDAIKNIKVVSKPQETQDNKTINELINKFADADDKFVINFSLLKEHKAFKNNIEDLNVLQSKFDTLVENNILTKKDNGNYRIHDRELFKKHFGIDVDKSTAKTVKRDKI